MPANASLNAAIRDSELGGIAGPWPSRGSTARSGSPPKEGNRIASWTLQPRSSPRLLPDVMTHGSPPGVRPSIRKAVGLPCQRLRR